jgi:hypothetical protein
MVGVICKWDVLAHPLVTIRCFGFRVFMRTLIAGRNDAFLSILRQYGPLGPSGETVLETMQRCIRLELIAKKAYESLARTFGSMELVREFFETLARQEQEHAELLELCRIVAGQSRRGVGFSDSWRDRVLCLERQMREAEVKLRAVKSTADAFWLTIEIESSEINQVFEGIVAAIDSEFVREFQVFRSAGREHLSYVAETITALEPSLKPHCQRMLSCYRQPVSSGGPITPG